jgi:hypothetical protein
MPPQLQRGLLVKRYSQCRDPRPIAEELSHTNINDLNIPRDHKTYSAPNISLRYPQLSAIRLTCNAVEFTHAGRTQTFRLKPIRTGFGYSRFAFICECQRSSSCISATPISPAITAITQSAPHKPSVNAPRIRFLKRASGW